MTHLMMNELMRRVDVSTPLSVQSPAATAPALREPNAKTTVLPNGVELVVLVGLNDKKKGKTSMVAYDRTTVTVLSQEKGAARPAKYEYCYETQDMTRNGQIFKNSKQNFIALLRQFAEQNPAVNVLHGG